MDTKNTGGFKSLGEFLVYVRKFYSGEHKDGRLKDLVEKTAGHMAEADDSQGGFTVPEEWATDIRYAAMEGAIVRPRAIVLPATTDTLHVRTLVDTNRSSNIFGGITFTWTKEAGDKASVITKPSIGLTTLNIHKLVGSCWVSNELEDDYAGFGTFMELAYGRAIRFIEDDVFLWGQGLGQPLGIMYSGALVTVARAGYGAAPSWVDLANMAARLLPDSWNRAVFLVNPDTLDNLLQMTLASSVAHLDMGQRRFFGIPIMVSEHCATMGALGDVILADFGQYVIGDREMSVAASREAEDSDRVGFTTDETFWRIVLRVDGQPLINAPITPKRGGATLSPFVALSVTS